MPEAPSSPTDSGSSSAYADLRDLLRDIYTLSGVSSLLAWDQETMMPPAGGTFRAAQIATVTRLTHEKICDPHIGRLLDSCETDGQLMADPLHAANLREIRRDYERQRKLPADLVARISESNSRGIEAWKRARGGNDFASFCPFLETQVELGRRKADHLADDSTEEAYDVLLQDYEPDMTASHLRRIFEPLRRDLIALLAEVDSAPRQPSSDPQAWTLPVDLQEQFTRTVVERLGFDFQAGRIDISTHPFSTAIGPGDTRLTTRYSGDRFLDALGSTMHEAGHAMYEQGLPKAAHAGEPLADCASLGVHESQSRLWDNEVGRSRPFWEWALPQARALFGGPFAGASVDDLYGAVNVVRRDLIRTEADELTYNLHIMLRFDLERAMVAGELAVADLPAAWNERMRADLGVTVPDDARGCLQDIHWAMGAIGYFPSYALGNLYAAQLWEAIRSTLPDLEQQIAEGDFTALLGWLRDNVHRHGRRYPGGEVCRVATGRDLDHGALIARLRSRLLPLYGVGSPASR